MSFRPEVGGSSYRPIDPRPNGPNGPKGPQDQGGAGKIKEEMKSHPAAVQEMLKALKKDGSAAPPSVPPGGQPPAHAPGGRLNIAV